MLANICEEGRDCVHTEQIKTKKYAYSRIRQQNVGNGS